MFFGAFNDTLRGPAVLHKRLVDLHGRVSFACKTDPKGRRQFEPNPRVKAKSSRRSFLEPMRFEFFGGNRASFDRRCDLNRKTLIAPPPRSERAPSRTFNFEIKGDSSNQCNVFALYCEQQRLAAFPFHLSNESGNTKSSRFVYHIYKRRRRSNEHVARGRSVDDSFNDRQ